MKKETIKLNSEVGMDLQKFIGTMTLLQASTGGGKSWAIRRILEQSFGKVPQIILDTEGEFSTLREKYDYILIGKGQDIAADPKTAARMALRLWEEGVSAIIDLYELEPWDRQLFVKNFLHAMINAPKKLWKPVLLVIDEAHEYAPENDKSESGRVMYSLASKGRKRGLGVVFATQRIATLSKNIVAATKNKMIGYTSFMDDMKRANEELGFGSDQKLALRQLDPGEFFVFGPALSKDIIKVKIGDVKTSHGSSFGVVTKVAPASEKVKKALAKLADLPQEMKNEEDLVSDLKQKLATITNELKRLQNADAIVSDKDLKIIIKGVEDEWAKKLFDAHTEYLKQVQNWFKILQGIGESMKTYTDKDQVKPPTGWKVVPLENVKLTKSFYGDLFKEHKKQNQKENLEFNARINGDFEILKSKTFGKCSRSIATYLYNNPKRLMSKTQVAIATGYSQNSGGFNNSIYELTTAGIISREGGRLVAAQDYLDATVPISIDTSIRKWSSKLGACSRAIWNLLLDSNDDRIWSKEEIAQETQYSPTSGGFNNSIYELSALGLIERTQGGIRINPEILVL